MAERKIGVRELTKKFEQLSHQETLLVSSQKVGRLYRSTSDLPKAYRNAGQGVHLSSASLYSDKKDADVSRGYEKHYSNKEQISWRMNKKSESFGLNQVDLKQSFAKTTRDTTFSERNKEPVFTNKTYLNTANVTCKDTIYDRSHNDISRVEVSQKNRIGASNPTVKRRLRNSNKNIAFITDFPLESDEINIGESGTIPGSRNETNTSESLDRHGHADISLTRETSTSFANTWNKTRYAESHDTSLQIAIGSQPYLYSENYAKRKGSAQTLPKKSFSMNSLDRHNDRMFNVAFLTGSTSSVVSMPSHNADRMTNEEYYKQSVGYQKRFSQNQRSVSEPYEIESQENRKPHSRRVSVFSSEESLNVKTQGNEAPTTQIYGSHVSVFSSEGSNISASRESLLSLNEDYRRILADDAKRKLEDFPKNRIVVETRAYKRAYRILCKLRLVIIVADEGSGATTISMKLLLGAKNNEAKTNEKFIVDRYQDFLICFRSKSKHVTVLLDDPFGVSFLNTNETDFWFKRFEDCKQMCQSAKQLNVIVTVKRHIANSLGQKLTAFKTNIVDLDDPKYSLNTDEMLDITKAIIKSNSNKCYLVCCSEDSKTCTGSKCHRKKYTHLSEEYLEKIVESSCPSGFPKYFQSFIESKENLKDGLSFFLLPKNVLQKVLHLKDAQTEEEQDMYLSLVMLSLNDGKLDSNSIEALEHATNTSIATSKKQGKKKKLISKKQNKLTDDLEWKTKVIAHYTRSVINFKERVLKGLDSMKGTFVVEGTRYIYFKSESVKYVVLLSWGKTFPHAFLKMKDSNSFKVLMERQWKKDDTNHIKIDTSNLIECQDALSLISIMLNNGDVDACSRLSIIFDQRFIAYFLDTIGKDTDALWKLCSTPDHRSGNDLLRNILKPTNCTFSYEYLETTLVYQLLHHPAWLQFRTSKKMKAKSLEIEQEVLKHCCRSGNESCFTELIDKFGIALNKSCLLAAITKCCPPIVEDILDSYRNQMKDEDLIEAMKCALIQYAKRTSKWAAIIVKLLSRFITVDYRTSEHEPFVHYATRMGDFRMIIALVNFEGDINVTNADKKTCLHIAALQNKVDILETALINGADQRKYDKLGRLPIHEAVIRNRVKVLKILFEHDRNILRQPDLHQMEPLHYAAKYSRFEAAKFLLENKVDTDNVDCEQKTPLHYAVESEKGTVVHILLEHKANVKYRNKEGELPLYIACKTGNGQAVKRILKDVKRSDHHIYSGCLFAAVEECHINVLKLLLRYGFDIQVHDNKGQSVFQKALETYLHVGNESSTSTSCKVIRQNPEALVRLLIECGADYTQTTRETQDTVLHLAIKNKHENLVFYLVQQSERRDYLISCRNKAGEVPLHIAATIGSKKFARALLLYGSEISPINKNGLTPLAIAERKLRDLNREQDVETFNNYVFTVDVLQKSGFSLPIETEV